MAKIPIRRLERKTRKKQYIILVSMLGAFLLLLISFAWYYFKIDREANSEEGKVMGSYYLYLLDEEADSLRLTIGSMHPGETKYVIVGVSNRPAEASGLEYIIGKESAFAYKFELAYTQNLPVKYKVYELLDEIGGAFQVQDPVSKKKRALSKYVMEKSEESASLTEENNKEMYGDEAVSTSDVTNYVQYELYSDDSKGDSLHLATTQAGLITSYELDYYLIEMTWEDGIEFQDFIKETDLIYVNVRAVQPKPTENSQ